MQALYLKDNYQQEFESTIISAKGKFIVLDQTLFYPNSGGQPNDEGVITGEDGTEYKVVFVGKFDGNISHEVDKEGLREGQKIKGQIDWQRRHILMRYHTAAHIFSEVIFKETEARITGNQLSLDKGRIDLDLENFDREKINDYADQANEIIQKNLEVKSYFMDREDAFDDPDLFSLRSVLPPSVKELRIVEIDGFDKKACGGTHVKNTGEIGTLTVTKAENKGKNNRRIYFTLGSK